MLFLNAGCVVPPNDAKEIETDDTFRDLIAGVEDLVILRAHRTFASAHPTQEAVTAARNIFGVASPAEVDLYRFKDYIDLFLWDHSRKYCMKRLKEAGAKLGCRVALSDTGSACDRADSTWIRIDRVLARREVK